MITDLVASLAKKPYYLPPEQSGRLTLRQVAMLVKRAGEKPETVYNPPSEREMFWYWGRQNKLREYQIQTLWDERKADKT